MKVELTKSQCYNIAEFIETNLLDTIRKNVDIDNFGYLEDLIDAKRTLEKAVKEYEGH